ncbi:MAG TPA: M20/M25/M40 family metallo-hydrolase [Edaphobacter sp.]|nr:M20/M25/M40 family metallo-hydrolase [Edaphobacter sp.]
MRFLTVLLAATLASPCALAQAPVSPDTRTAITQLVGDIMVNGKAYDYDRHLADNIGPRLTGSDNYVHAVSWAVDQFKSLGLKNVHTEPFTMPALWEPEVLATGHILEPRNQTLHIYSLGWSPSTPHNGDPDAGIQGQVVYLKDFSTPEALEADKAKIPGKIVLIDEASLGEHPSFAQILKTLIRLKELGPQALLLVGGPNGTESATALTFDGSIAPFPEARIGLEDELLIKRLLEDGPVTVQFSFKNRIRPATQVNNVVAEIPGRDLPNEIVIVGGHLDSWHPATGAQDNGTGVATALDVARAVKAVNRPPRRTLRFILFGGEEQGIIGSTSYVRHHTADLPNIDAVLISDTGGQPAKGWYLMGRDDEKQALANIEPLLSGLGSNDTTPSVEFLFQTDHISFALLGTPTLVLWNAVDKYFKLHHKASDSFDSVVQADLNQGVATTAATAYAIADSAKPFAAHYTPTQVEDMLKQAKQFDDYQYFKSQGIFP